MYNYIYMFWNTYISLSVFISVLNYRWSHLRLIELYLQSGVQRLKDYPQPFWLALFVEGTRFTQAKLLAAQEYAASTGLPVPRNVLIPRTKVRFSLSLSHFPFGRFYFYFYFSTTFWKSFTVRSPREAQKKKKKPHKCTVLRSSHNNC